MTRSAKLAFAIGALTTLATSAPVSPRLEGEALRAVEPGETVRIEVTLDDPALFHLRRHGVSAVQLDVSGDAVGAIITDDPSVPVQALPVWALEIPLDECLNERSCTRGASIAITERGSLFIEAWVEVGAHGGFISLDDREFPEEAHLTLVIE